MPVLQSPPSGMDARPGVRREVEGEVHWAEEWIPEWVLLHHGASWGIRRNECERLRTTASRCCSPATMRSGSLKNSGPACHRSLRAGQKEVSVSWLQSVVG